MIKIYSGGEKITYTAGDTFEISVSSAEGFEEKSTLLFQVAKSENEEFLVNSAFDLINDEFIIILTDEEKGKLPIGEYIYKLVLINEKSEVVTQKSGELVVKWGAWYGRYDFIGTKQK